MLARLRHLASRVDDADRTLTRRIGELPRSPADDALKTITTSANHSLLWFAIAAVLAARRGVTRRAAVRGALAIGGASFTANALCKPLLPRRRPAADALPTWRTVPNPPTSSSFPSGHAASAAAFCTAVSLESPMAGAAVAPLAVTVAYSRVHVGVHWPSDVVVGATIGAAVALGTQRWWPRRPPLPARARPYTHADALPAGESLVVMTNPCSGAPSLDPGEEVIELLPAARAVTIGYDIARQLDSAVHSAPAGSPDGSPEGTSGGSGGSSGGSTDGSTDGSLGGSTGTVRAVGVAGGDGSVAAVAEIALDRGLPLAVLPTGTFNHFARDVGVESPADTAAALAAGSAVSVDIAKVTVDGTESRALVNTASLGGYPDLVRLRERWQHGIGKWPAAALALIRILAAAKPLSLDIDGRPVSAWLLFVGNGPYEPRGMAPAWRPALDTGLLDIRYVRAGVPLSRTRFVLAVLAGALSRSRIYVQREAPRLRVEVHGRPVALATDGEVCLEGNAFEFAIAPTRLVVYRP